ncbi:MAG: DUF1598 domain-containing protein [Pirellulales bacterium]
MLRRIGFCGVLSLVACGLMAVSPGRLLAQGGGGMMGGASLGGVLIDADGVLKIQYVNDMTGQLTKARVNAGRAALRPEVAAKSGLRKVSLNRLEAELTKLLENGQAATDEMKYLVGLTRIQYVFYYPDTKDIVIAGPAEGWFTDLTGRVRGINSGRPVMELQDLIVALRTFAPGRGRSGTVGCTIDPTQEGLVRLQGFLKSLGSTTTRNVDTVGLSNGMKNALGLHTVKIMGVSPDTHFAQVLVEADYRMKLIGLGLEAPPAKMDTYVSKASPSGSKNAMARWYFTPDYECVRASQDNLAMELVGTGVKLVSADEIVGADGTRANSTKIDRAAKAYATSFTKKFPEIANVQPVFAQLRNMVDMAIAAAYIQQHGYHEQAGWKMDLFSSEESYPVETYSTPTMVEAACNVYWKSSTLMMPIGGGVLVQAEKALEQENLLSDKDGAVEKARAGVSVGELAEGEWWWD